MYYMSLNKNKFKFSLFSNKYNVKASLKNISLCNYHYNIKK